MGAMKEGLVPEEDALRRPRRPRRELHAADVRRKGWRRQRRDADVRHLAAGADTKDVLRELLAPRRRLIVADDEIAAREREDRLHLRVGQPRVERRERAPDLRARD